MATNVAPPRPPILGGACVAGASRWSGFPTPRPIRKPPRWPKPAPPRIGGRGGAVALALLSLLIMMILLPAAVAADPLDDQVRAIARELRCPVCAGETVADSNAQISIQMRGLIRQKLEAGETPEQIKAYFVERYGEGILATPPAKGFTLGVWIAPIVALLVGLAIVGTV